MPTRSKKKPRLNPADKLAQVDTPLLTVAQLRAALGSAPDNALVVLATTPERTRFRAAHRDIQAVHGALHHGTWGLAVDVYAQAQARTVPVVILVPLDSLRPDEAA